MYVIKRNGDKQNFDKERIYNAIISAFYDVDGEINEYADLKAWNIADYIEKYTMENGGEISVEKCQDLCERGLMSTRRKDVAQSFIRYRYEHELRRRDELNQLFAEKLFAEQIDNQNANVDEHSFGGRMGEANSVMMKDYALNHCMSKMAKRNHLNNEIYIHDLDQYAVGTHNCLMLPIDDLLALGFNTRQTDVRPANSVNTAFQLVAVLFQLQSLNMFGGVAASHIDWTMVPYVRKSFYKHFIDGLKYCEPTDYSLNKIEVNFNMSIEDGAYQNYPYAYNYAIDMTKKETYQAVEGFFHNLNTLQSRSGNQLPFSSINFGTCTLPEGRMVIQALLEVSLDGMGKLHKTPIFPCSIFQCMKGVNREPGDPNYDLFKLALQSTAKRLYPNYANVDWSTNKGYDKNDPSTYVAVMGCRTYNGFDINANEGINPQRKDGRGNICPVTIILPTLAMEAKINAEKAYSDCKEEYIIDTFMAGLNGKIFEAKDMLLERYNWICSQSPSSAQFMYENKTFNGFDGKTIESAMKHGTLTIGQLGLAETLQLLIGENQITSKGMALAKQIEQLFFDRCAEFKKKYNLNFATYATPAENLCYTAMKKFKQRYGIIPNVSDREYFTNSIHIPVWEKVSPFEKIDIESQLTGYINGGVITYVELDGSVKNNIEALEQLVNYAMDKDIPYFAINVPNDTCLECGYTDEFNDECPMCGSHNIQQLRRVTGYLTGNYKTAFNEGKIAETDDRQKHSGVKL